MLSSKVLRTVLAFVSLMCFAAGARGQTTWYVDDDASSGGDGTTWATAYNSLSTTLTAAQSGDQIWVAAGTYVGNFTLALGVEVYGGFVGTETQLSERDWEANPTILDGNQTGSVVTAPPWATETTRIDGFTITNGSGTTPFGPYTRGGGMYIVFSSPTIANNTITGNHASLDGGGLYLSSSSPTIANNMITSNRARWGGGLYLLDSSPTIANNTITGNYADYDGGGLYLYDSSPMIADNTITGNGADNDGGGLYLRSSAPTIANNTIMGNSADNDGGGLYLSGSSATIANNTITGNSARYGGGMYVSQSSPTIANNTITDNGADHDGGGLHLYDSSPTIANNTITGNGASRGGGLYMNRSSPTIANNTITGNGASRGGGLYLYDSFPTIANNTITGNSAHDGGGLYLSYSSPTIANNTITGNGADFFGGGLYLSDHSSPTITNNTITGNRTDYYGGGLYVWQSSPMLANNTVTGNGASRGGGLYLYDSFPTIANTIVAFNSSGIYLTLGAPTLRYNCVYGNMAYDYYGLSDPTGTDGNISADPVFVHNPDPGPDGLWGTPDDDPGDLQLSSGSPCIDAGDNDSVPPDTPDLDGDSDTEEPLPFDLAGGPRFLDDPTSPDTGNPGVIGPPIVDVGAYENAVWCGNGVVDPGEECDDGGESATCDADCTIAECGDGTVNTTAGEECDDGNAQPGDGCDANCHIESEVIPTVSQWGLTVMALLLLSGLKVKFGQRRSAHA